MKKFILLLLIAFNLFAINVFGSTESVEYSFDITEGKRWNLETGSITDDERFTITNREIIKPSTNNRIEFDALLFHHILFYDRFNNYLGYYNSPFSILERGDKYLGQLTNNYVDIPANAYSFSLMNYSANANTIITKYGLDEIENPITLNQLFLNGTEELSLGFDILNPNDIDADTSVFQPSAITLTGYDQTTDTYYMIANPDPSWIAFPYFLSNVRYTMQIKSFEIKENETYFLTYDDAFGSFTDKSNLGLTFNYYDRYDDIIIGEFDQFTLYDEATQTFNNNFEITTPEDAKKIEVNFTFNISPLDELTDFNITNLDLKQSYDTPINFYHNDLTLLGVDFLTDSQLLDLYLDYESFRNPNSVRYEELGYIALDEFFENNNFVETANNNTIIYGKSTSFNTLFNTEQPTRNLFYPEDLEFRNENTSYYDHYLSDFIKVQPFKNYKLDGFNRLNLTKQISSFPTITYSRYSILAYDESFNLIDTEYPVYNSTNDNYTFSNSFLDLNGNIASYIKVRIPINDLDTFMLAIDDASTYEYGIYPNEILNDITELRTTGTITDQIFENNGNIILRRNVGYIQDADTPLTDLNGYTINNTFYDDFNLSSGGNNVYMEGLTLVNDLVNGDFSDGTTGWNATNGTLINENNQGKLTVSSGNTPYLLNTYDVESNKYFIYFNVNIINTPTRIRVYTNVPKGDSPTLSGLNNYGKIFTTTAHTSFRLFLLDSVENDVIYFDNIMLINMTALGIEDYTEDEMLNLVRQGYFEGIASIQEPSITSVGKNLFDKNDITSGYGINAQGDIVNNINAFVSDYIPVLPNTQYIKNVPYAVVFYDSKFNKISNILNANSFITPANTAYVRFDQLLSLIDTTQLEQGSSATTYEPYKSSTISFSAGGTWDGELRSLPNGTFDYINASSGDYILTKQIGSITSLDQPLNELNGLTLSQVFNNSVSQNYSVTNLTETFFATLDYNVSLNDTYYVKNTQTINSGNYSYLSIQERNPTTNTYNIIGNGSIKFIMQTSTLRFFYFNLNNLTANLSYVFLNLSDLGLENLSTEQLDTFYEAYQTLQTQDEYLYELEYAEIINLTDLGLVSGELTGYHNGTIYGDSDTFIRFKLDPSSGLNHYDRDYENAYDNRYDDLRLNTLDSTNFDLDASYNYFKNNIINTNYEDSYYELFINHDINLTDKLSIYYEAGLSFDELYDVKDLYDNVLANTNPYALGINIIGNKRYYSMQDNYLIALDLLGIDENITEQELEAYYQEYLDNLQIEATLYLNVLSGGSFEIANPQYSREPVEPSELDTDAPGFLENVLLDNLGFNNTIGQTILSIAVIFGAMFLLASLKLPSSVIIGVGAMLYVGLSFIGWVPAWITIIITLVILVLLIFKFTGKGGGSNETDD